MTSARDLKLRNKSILVVDDHDPIRSLLINYLGTLGCHVDGASGGRQALQMMSEATYDLVLLDMRMDDMDGLTVLKQAKADRLARNYIMMSAEGTVPSAVDAIHLGASDFLLKPFELHTLRASISEVLGPDDGETSAKDSRMLWRDRYAPSIIGEHPLLLDIFLVLERVAHADSTVLVTGESGTGKELIAKAVHDSSPRAKQQFIAVNCGAIPETLIESELFGHAKGAFTGAITAREGRFAAAEKSSLFLDEIGEMSLAVQVKFLRVLQQKEYVPVGEARPRSTDVRIVAATNRDLEQLVREGKFREDLYYRLNIIPITLPPLRTRQSDIPLLANYFLKLCGERHGKTYQGFTPEAMTVLEHHDWPGNIRELENTIERVTVLDSGSQLFDIPSLSPRLQLLATKLGLSGPANGPRPKAAEPSASQIGGTQVSTIAPAMRPVELVTAQEARRESAAPVEVPILPSEPREAATPLEAPIAVFPAAPAATSGRNAAGEELVEIPGFSPNLFIELPQAGIDLKKTVEAIEGELIRQALERTGQNRNQAAQLLGLNRTTLVEKLKKRQANGKS